MDEFVRDLNSPSWWIGVVIVGILINLLSAYLKPRLDQNWDSVSKWLATRTQQKREQRRLKIEHLRVNPHHQLLAAFDEVHCRLRSVAFTVTGLFFLSFPLLTKEQGSWSMVFAVFGVLSVLQVMTNLFEATRISLEVLDANRREQQNQKPIS